jgi:UDP-N-acetylmuramate--alanine ligase
MKTINQYSHAYFLGIGGIGMSAICRYLHELGLNIGGYDKTRTELTDSLQDLGIQISFEDSVSAFPEWIESHITDTLFIITPAIPANHPQRVWLEKQQIPVYKRAEVLGIITRNTRCLAVAGTHGKTTTSSLLAHILMELNKPFSAFLGGISTNIGSNYVRNLGSELGPEPELVVVEADEFDRSFHQLNPSAAIITAIDADHLDIYETPQAFKKAFEIFASKIQTANRPTLFINGDLEWPQSSHTNRYGRGPEADYQITEILITDHQFHFVIRHNETDHDFIAGLPGYHNVYNAAACIALCHGFLHIPFSALQGPIKNFKGVKRRFEYLINSSKAIVIDDYAHHPEELNMIISSVKNLYPESLITGIFQPHLYSRTQDFALEFAQSLNALDTALLLDIYPAREIPIPGITSQYVQSLMNNPNARVVTKEEALNWVKEEKPKVLLLLGAGDIDTLRNPIIKIYE